MRADELDGVLAFLRAAERVLAKRHARRRDERRSQRDAFAGDQFVHGHDQVLEVRAAVVTGIDAAYLLMRHVESLFNYLIGASDRSAYLNYAKIRSPPFTCMEAI